MVRHLKFMADYHCWPLWHGDGSGEVGNIDPATLPISDALKAALLVWPEQIDNALDWDYPPDTVWPGGFWTNFNAEGRELAARLRAELGPGYQVEEHFWGEDPQ